MPDTDKEIRCPECASDDVDVARAAIIGTPFDYVKECGCCGHQFLTDRID